jgi:nucleoside-diphosphate-sugar epimerase
MAMSEEKLVLVLGANGGIGGEVARQLRDAGWQVRALKRDVDAAGVVRDGIRWIRGDVMNAADVHQAAADCSVIIHAVNPPGYRNWPKLVMPMLENSIAAARAQRATIVLPGTVYNYNPDQAGPLGEDAPQRPISRKGAIRCEMEERLRAATEQGVRVLIVRAGDYFGPRSGNNWFSMGMIKPGQPVAAVSNPSTPGAGHQWGYLPDVARTMVELLDRRETLPAFARFHMAGHWDADGTQMARAIQRVVAQRAGTEPSIKPVAWWLFKLMAPFMTTLREMQEMRYLWRRPLRLEGSLLAQTLGREPHTPLDEAVEASLRGQRCL